MVLTIDRARELMEEVGDIASSERPESSEGLLLSVTGLLVNACGSTGISGSVGIVAPTVDRLNGFNLDRHDGDTSDDSLGSEPFPQRRNLID